jgi:rhodanese-related sulfurtransferase
MSVRTISPKELADLCGKADKIDLIDVRTPMEYQEVHATVARNVPLDQLDPAAVWKSRQCGADSPLYVICRSGSRGQQACQKFLQAGFTSVVNVEGGTLAWEKCGLPVQRGRKVVSLQRQVQMIAGSLIVLGVVLGWTVHPACSGLSLAMGAGLFMTGVTDSCLMGMMLAKMPWNRVTPAAPSCSAR